VIFSLSWQVIKVGTSSLLRPEQQTLNLTNLARMCETIKVLHSSGAGVWLQSDPSVA
jgi:glutamate 5-kinase